MIPKIIHISWKHYNFLKKKSIFIDNCIGNLVKLSKNWKYKISNDKDVDNYLKENLEKKDYDLLKNKHIVEKCDVWRLLKVYNEGGVYTDIDKLCNVSLDSIINEKTKLVLPTCRYLDFSQDFMMSAPQNPIFMEALKLNLERRYLGCNNIYYLGPQTYLHGIMMCVLGKLVDQNEENVIFMKNQIQKYDFIVTYNETPPYDTLIYNNKGKKVKIDYEKEKMKYYTQSKIGHWTGDW